MDLDDVQRHWNEWGRRDPYFAIISRPDRRGNRWDLDEFFRTGVDDIDAMLGWLQKLHVPVEPGRVLDFGCGVGRLTQALARTFAECDGVDIAPSMIERARELNQFGDRVRYHVNDRNDLTLFEDGSFDLVYSIIVLQHIEPVYSMAYVREFARILAPGGVVVFQLPSHALAADEQPARIAAIADDVCRAEIVPTETALDIEAGADVQLAVSVHNTSSEEWPNDWYVTLGNHWRTADGAVAVVDDGRASLGITVAPGDALDITLDMHAPTDPGAYLLELDLVVEGVTWFADRGSPTSTIPVHVTPRADTTNPDEDRIDPVMEVYGVPRAEVEAQLRALGLHVVSVEETDMAGGWRDYWYVAVKSEGAPRALRRGIRNRFRRD